MKNGMISWAERGRKIPGRARRDIRSLQFSTPMSRLNRIDHETAFFRTLAQAVTGIVRKVGLDD